MDLFNLTERSWIPVRNHRGDCSQLSLLELFEQPESYADLDARPRERISVMRLLICITQSAIGAPLSGTKWDGFGTDLSAAVTAYLHEWSGAFNLWGTDRRFLQFPIDDGAVMHISKLTPSLASGGNPTWQDHGGGETRTAEPREVALALLTLQNCAPLFGRGYKGRGPCTEYHMIHTLRRGANIRELILNNCVDRSTIDKRLGGMGQPIWEQFPSSLSDSGAIKNATKTYLGRLVPLHRLIWLHDDQAFITVSAGGWTYPRFEIYREPTATVLPASTKPKKDERLLSGRLDRAIWRDLSAMTVLTTHGQHGAPLILQSHASRLRGPVDIWTGAVITDWTAKMEGTIESVFRIPAGMFTRRGHVIYANGVAYAEARRAKLWGAVNAYAESLKMDEPPDSAAERFFWNDPDQHSQILIDIAGEESIEAVEFGNSDPWTNRVRAAADGAFIHACPRDTPRQLKAFMEGLRVLQSGTRR